MAHRPHLVRIRTASAAPRRQRRTGARVLPALVALVVLGLTACSGSGAGGSGESALGADTAAEDSGGDVDSQGLGSGLGRGGDAPSAAKRVGRVAPLSRQVIRTGEVTVQGEDVQGLRDEVDRLVQRYGGYVASEKSFTDERGRMVEDRLVLRVPSTRYDRLLAGFDELGTVLEPSTRTEDVTTEVLDVDSRVRTAEVSLERLRGFLSRSDDVDTLIRLESEIADREADLASLRAQQDYLEDQTSLATLSVTLQRPPEQEPGDPGDGGFLAGLAGGWSALEGVLVVAVTLLGAVIPFALAAALVGVPALLVVRATRRRRPAPPPEAPVPQGT